jgi:diketogulonate reductase-like aldo/keto reductase
VRIAFEELHRSGRVRAIGVSNFQERHLREVMGDAKVKPCVNQIECHPRLSQAPLLALCAGHGIAVEAWSPLGGEGGDLLQDASLKAIGARYGTSVAQVILRWDLQRGLITIPKSVRRERIHANADLYAFELSAEDMSKIDALNEDRRFGASPDNFDF